MDKNNNYRHDYGFDKKTLVHLRVPFSYHLMPVFLFALSQAAAEIIYLLATMAIFQQHFICHFY